MIELNLSFEESKKILELGYDFSPVCVKFVSDVYHRDEFLKVAPDLYAAVGVRRYYENIYKPIPIIPKAVLESCCFIKSGMLADYVEPYLCQVFKNFMWSHERHPESTKARFKKVMGIWLT